MDTIEAIMGLIKKEDLDRIGKMHAVDRYNTKVRGEILLKGLMTLILRGQKTSLRMLEMVVNQGIINEEEPEKTVTHSGLSRRINTINPCYFKSIYESVVERGLNEIPTKTSQVLHRFDSTMITLSSHLLKDGLRGGGGSETNTQIKVSIGMKKQLPTSVRFCKEQKEINENHALIHAINEAKVEKEDILLFDRGIYDSKLYEEFSRREYKFITRINVGRKHEIIKERKVSNSKDIELKILEDSMINLYAGGAKKTKTSSKSGLRLIKAINKAGTELWFLTNMSDTPAHEIAELYKRRWDIEVFFKFIKQNLGYKHFLSHSTQGMQVYIYMIMITAIMFLMYKIRLKLEGYKIPLFRFTLELQKSFMKSIILYSGGDPELVKHQLGRWI